MSQAKLAGLPPAGALRDRPLAGLGLAVGSTVVALGVRIAVGPAFPSGFPFLTFFPAILLSSYFAGARAGGLCALLSLLAAWYFVIAPENSFSLGAGAALALLFFAGVAGAIIALIAAMQLALDRLSAERQLVEKLYDQQRTLFGELQHRVANNMAFISSLLRLQKRRIAENPGAAAQAFDEAVARIELMSRVHRRLYDPAAANQALAAHLQAMCDELLLATGCEGVRCLVDLPAIAIPLDRLLPLSLLVAEAVTNSIKHGFRGREGGIIRILLEHDNGGRPVLVIRDNGVGLPAGGGVPASGGRPAGLGLRIMDDLAAQIGGRISQSSDGGAVTRISLPG